MPLVTLVRSWLNRPRHRRRRSGRTWPKPLVEQLEQRNLLAVSSLVTITAPPPPGDNPPADPGPGNPSPTGGQDTTALSSFVTRLYLDLLHRAPSADEVNGWDASLLGGVSPAQIATAFIHSPEYQTNVIQEDYRAFLGRNGSPGEVGNWLGALQAGMSENHLAVAFLSSDEFYIEHGNTDTGWLTGVYGVALGRAPGAGGISSWTEALDEGTSRAAVAVGIWQSSEAHQFLVADNYAGLLGRTPDPGAGTWVGQLDAGLAPELFVASVAGSLEFFDGPADPGPQGPSDAAVTSAASGNPAPANSWAISTQGYGSTNMPIMVYADGVPSTRGRIGPGGQWSLALAGALTTGPHSLSVLQMNGGPAFSPSAGYSFIAGPPAPTVTVQAPDFTTNVTPTITVTATSNDGSTINSQVSIDVDLKNNGKFTDPGDQDFTTGFIGAGTNSIVLNTLPRGTFNVRARVTDSAGALGVSAAVIMTVDPYSGIVGAKDLLALAQAYADAGTPPASFFSSRKHLFVFDASGRVLVNVHSTLLKYLDTLDTELKQVGFHETLKTTAQYMVTGFLPIPEIPNLPSLEHFDSVTPVYAPILKTGSVDTQGDALTKADTFRNSTGLTGVGVTVGVISDSVNEYQGGLADSVSTGDLPANVNVIQDDPSGGGADEGRAMLEIVHDIAPGAGLAFSTGSGGPQAFATSISALAAVGAKVIVDDIGYANEPMFNDGILAQAVDRAAAKGVFFPSASGNDGNTGFVTPWRTTTINAGGTPLSALDFGGGSPFQQLTVAQGSELRLDVQWDSAFLEGGSPLPNYQVANDVDVYLVNPNGNIVASSTNNNPNTGEALELLDFVNTTATTNFRLACTLFSGPAPGFLRWLALTGSGSTDPMAAGEGAYTIYGHDVAKGVIAVGAVDYLNPTVAESYSDLGGNIPILFDAAGNRLATADIRVQPNLMGPDDVNTSFFSPGQDTEGDGFPNFTGTSAAAPHVAGVAALLLQQNPTATPAQLRTHLDQTALDLVTPGFDPTTGNGLVQVVSFPPSSPGGGGGGVSLPSDPFDPIDETSVTAATPGSPNDFGLLLPGAAATLSNLTINKHPDPDYDWFGWRAGAAGTFTATVTINQAFGDLELHLFTLGGPNGQTLIQLGAASSIVASGQNSITVTTPIPLAPGQAILVEIKGKEDPYGSFGQAFYTLGVSLN